jgi:tRNA (guanine-N7-)-methyltransferase
MRKVKWAVDYLDQAAKLAKNPEENKGNWKEKLNRSVLHVEIGAGKGRYSLDMANMNPEEGFVAIEKNESAAGIAAKKFDEQAEHDNLLLIQSDAASLSDWFAKKEIDVIHLNFSDPWPKKRYAKRRLSSSSFLEQYYNLLNDEGRIEMKTDNKALFEYSVAEFSKNNFYFDEVSVDYRRDPHPEDAITEYEEKFIDLNQPIYRFVARKDLRHENHS